MPKNFCQFRYERRYVLNGSTKAVGCKFFSQIVKYSFRIWSHSLDRIRSFFLWKYYFFTRHNTYIQIKKTCRHFHSISKHSRVPTLSFINQSHLFPLISILISARAHPYILTLFPPIFPPPSLSFHDDSITSQHTRHPTDSIPRFIFTALDSW